MRFMDSSSAGGVSQSGGLLDLDPDHSNEWYVRGLETIFLTILVIRSTKRG